ncbi:uncharacterized protein LOC143041974 [Mytilus galloprovincialis]|uniref:uncharacterized protein LOC143041974 n=1 Tax=Mytilus galloprovincialis TaxID=29158 RepID=UPI003F7C29FC
MENRPLDEGLCSRYNIDLLNIHKKLNEIDTSIQGISSSVQGMDSSIQELLIYHRNEAICQYCKKKLNEQGLGERQINPYKLGQDIFYLHHQIDLESLLGESLETLIPDVVMMDDGRLVLCLLYKYSLLICNTDGSQVDSIPVEGEPRYVTAVNNSTVAVTVDYPFKCPCIEMYNINNKHKLKSISVPRINSYCGITMMNNKLVVGGDGRLQIVDHQTGEIVQTIETDCIPRWIHASGDKIFFINPLLLSCYNNLYWYSFTDDNIQTLTLPSRPWSITTLQDGSLYVLCEDKSVQHVSSNGKQFKTLKTNHPIVFNSWSKLYYNLKQRKMITYNTFTGIVKILQEK